MQATQQRHRVMNSLIVKDLVPGRVKWVCALILITLGSPLQAQLPTPKTVSGGADFSTARKLIQDRIAAESIPSVSIAVARKGEILWVESFGWSDRENQVPATEHTRITSPLLPNPLPQPPSWVA